VEGAPPVVWIVDVEQWPRAMLRAELIERGFDAAGYVTVRDAIDSLPWRRSAAIVVDLRGQPLPLVERLLGSSVPLDRCIGRLRACSSQTTSGSIAAARRCFSSTPAPATGSCRGVSASRRRSC